MYGDKIARVVIAVLMVEADRAAGAVMIRIVDVHMVGTVRLVGVDLFKIGGDIDILAALLRRKHRYHKAVIGTVYLGFDRRAAGVGLDVEFLELIALVGGDGHQDAVVLLIGVSACKVHRVDRTVFGIIGIEYDMVLISRRVCLNGRKNDKNVQYHADRQQQAEAFSKQLHGVSSTETNDQSDSQNYTEIIIMK